MSTSLDAGACRNCGEAVRGAYCAACGQKHGFRRHSLRRLAGDAVARTLNLDGGLLHTALRLTRSPGGVVRDYVNGRTRPYAHPLGYLLICCAIFALVARLAGGMTGGGSDNQFFSLLLVPCIAAAARALFWRRQLNYAEHLILAMFVFAQVVLFLAVLLSVTALLPGDLIHHGATGVLAAAGMLAVAYFGWAYSGLFEEKRLAAAAGGVAAAVAGALLWLALLLLLLGWFRSRQ